MKRYFILLFHLALVAGCSTVVPKDDANDNGNPQTNSNTEFASNLESISTSVFRLGLPVGKRLVICVVRGKNPGDRKYFHARDLGGGQLALQNKHNPNACKVEFANGSHGPDMFVFRVKNSVTGENVNHSFAAVKIDEDNYVLRMDPLRTSLTVAMYFYDCDSPKCTEIYYPPRSQE